MKLVHPDFFCPIEFEENRIETVVIEDPCILSQYVFELKNEIQISEGQWVLSDKAEIMEVEKKCCMIMDPFSVNLNNRKMLAALYDMVDKEVKNTELLLEWNKVFPGLLRVMDTMLAQIGYSLSYADDIQVKDFLKFMDLRYNDESECFFEKLLDYMRLTHEILKIDLFVFVNIKTFLSREQLGLLYQQSWYDKYQMLLFESHYDLNDKLAGEKITIIDKDSCVIQ